MYQTPISCDHNKKYFVSIIADFLVGLLSSNVKKKVHLILKNFLNIVNT